MPEQMQAKNFDAPQPTALEAFKKLTELYTKNLEGTTLLELEAKVRALLRQGWYKNQLGQKVRVLYVGSFPHKRVLDFVVQYEVSPTKTERLPVIMFLEQYAFDQSDAGGREPYDPAR